MTETSGESWDRDVDLVVVGSGAGALVAAITACDRGGEVLLTGRPISARRGYEIGLVNRLVPSVEEVLPTAMELAKLICENSPLAVKTAKEIAVRAWNHEPGYVLENALFQKVRESEDAKEGPRSYMERRKPRFVGR